ncbi:hypothetical protein KGM_209190 [Danaus plexippus plexippus]|uniref:Uncharacterized protein n=1 Tax=Danaus plexippus plexippus TaxID=278856 RepID=A0A212ESQ6_DANPL|nr:hypothetical protein KGM_209190 [Danaus plexippus plexippus]
MSGRIRLPFYERPPSRIESERSGPLPVVHRNQKVDIPIPSLRQKSPKSAFDVAIIMPNKHDNIKADNNITECDISSTINIHNSNMVRAAVEPHSANAAFVQTYLYSHPAIGIIMKNNRRNNRAVFTMTGNLASNTSGAFGEFNFIRDKLARNNSCEVSRARAVCDIIIGYPIEIL